jgi:hypothetical protein
MPVSHSSTPESRKTGMPKGLRVNRDGSCRHRERCRIDNRYPALLIIQFTIASQCVLGLLTLAASITPLGAEQTPRRLPLSTSKSSDPLFEFLPRDRNHWVSTVPMPELVARPTPVSQQVEVVEFLPEKSIRLGCVVAIKRSFLRPAPLTSYLTIPPCRPSSHRTSHPQPVVAIEVLLVLFPPSHESAFRVESATLQDIYPAT